jgi:hypothetical protein
MGSWLASFLLSRRAGFKADFPREYGDWIHRPVILLPSPLTGTENNLMHVHTKFWDKLRQYVDQGGVVYASVSGDAAVPGMEDLFGARLADHIPVNEVELKILASLGNLKPGDTFKFSASAADFREWGATLEVKGGRVIATDQDGHPALVAFNRGAGKTLLSAYPLELYLSKLPSAFERVETTHRIYQALLEWAGLQPLFHTDQPSVEVAALRGERRGYAILANHSGQSLPVVLESSIPIRSLQEITTTSQRPTAPRGKGWTLQLPPYGGAVLKWEQ